MARPKPKNPRGMQIRAEAHTDDRVFEVGFDASRWFAEATDDQIMDLALCGWGGDYPADDVAIESSAYRHKLALMFEYLNSIQGLASKKDCSGFECHVSPKSAMRWLKAHRPRLYAVLTAHQGEGTQR